MLKKILPLALLILVAAGCGEDFKWFPDDGTGTGGGVSATNYQVGTWFDDQEVTDDTATIAPYEVITRDSTQRYEYTFKTDLPLTCGDAKPDVTFIDLAKGSEHVGAYLKVTNVNCTNQVVRVFNTITAARATY